MDDLNEFDGLLDYLRDGGGPLQASDQRLLQQQQQQQRFDQPSFALPQHQGTVAGGGIQLTVAGGLPGMTGMTGVSVTGMTGGGIGGMMPGTASAAAAITMPGTTPMLAAPTMAPNSALLAGSLGLPQHVQHGAMVAGGGGGGLVGMQAGAAATGAGGLLGGTFGGSVAGVGLHGLSNLGTLGGLGALGNLGALGGLAGAGSLGQLDALLSLQTGVAAGMAPGGGGMLSRASVTTAAGGAAGLGGGMGMPGIGGLHGGYAAAAFGGGVMGAGLTAAAPAATAKGGGGGSRRGRSAQRPGATAVAARRSEYDLGSSDGELDSNSDSASSDGDVPAHKANKKKREGGGGGGGGEDVADRRHAALQEKNRKAQRRFRERQKTKLMELHKQIEELAGKVSNLQTENAALHSRTSILEKVLDMRNEQIQVMQENKEVAEAELASLGSGPALVPLSPEAIKELTSEDIYRVYQTYVKELSVRLVDATVAPPPPATRGSAEPATAGGEAAAAADSAECKVEAAAATGGGSGEGGEVEGLAAAAAAGGAPSTAAQAELERLVRELSVMLMRLGVARPLEARKFIVFSRQYLGNTEKEVIELWKSVMKHIELSPEQMREIVELKRMFLTKIEPIMEERKHLNISIQTNLPHDTFHTKSSISYIKAHEAVSKLRDNLRSEQHVVLEFAIAVFRGVFRPAQMAALLVRCYPAVPDALGIASALATELGEPDSPATQQLAMQLGGYAVPGSGASGGSGSGAAGLLAIHPSLMPIDANVGVGQQLLQQQQAAAQQLLQQQQLLPLQPHQQQMQQQQQQMQQQQMQQLLPQVQHAGLQAAQMQQPAMLQLQQHQQQALMSTHQQQHQHQQQQQMQQQSALQQQQLQLQQQAQQIVQLQQQQMQQRQQQQQLKQLQQMMQQQQQQQQQALYGNIMMATGSPDSAVAGLGLGLGGLGGLLGNGGSLGTGGGPLTDMRARSGSISGSSAATPTGGSTGQQ